MEHSVSENANCNAVKEIHDMVEHVKQDAEVSLEYMKVYEKERMLIEEGIRLLRKELAERQKIR